MSSSGAKRLSLAGAIVTAVAASSCCLGPLVLAALGMGGAGAFAGLAGMRPYILSLTAALLGLGFYLTYRKPQKSAGDACGCERPTAHRAGKIGLWMATVLVVFFAVSPTLLAHTLGHAATAPRAGTAIGTATIAVRGADCEACAVHLRAALAKVGGFQALVLDVPSQTITVTYEPAAGRLEAYVTAIDDLGYEATLTDGKAAR